MNLDLIVVVVYAVHEDLLPLWQRFNAEIDSALRGQTLASRLFRALACGSSLALLPAVALSR